MPMQSVNISPMELKSGICSGGISWFGSRWRLPRESQKIGWVLESGWRNSARRTAGLRFYLWDNFVAGQLFDSDR